MTICNLDQFLTDESVTFLAEIIKENSTYWEVKGTETDLKIVNDVLEWQEEWFSETAFYRQILDDDRDKLGHNEGQFIAVVLDQEFIETNHLVSRATGM